MAVSQYERARSVRLVRKANVAARYSVVSRRGDRANAVWYATRDPVVGDRGVIDLRAPAWHVACNAVVAILLPQRVGCRAPLLSVALQAAAAVVGDLAVRRGQLVRIVTGNAAHLGLAAAPLK